MAGVVLAFLTAAPLGAQVTETPVAFDSVGRIRTLTPAIVTRLGLTAPAWPASGVFREARLLSASTGGHVLAVDRSAGVTERYPMSDDAVAALRAAVDAGVARAGFIVTEERVDVIGVSARGHFIRRQMALAWFLYGPLAASLLDSDEGSDVATAVYLASVPASFFIVQRVSRNMQVTRAQSSLAFDGAVRGLFTGWGLLYVASGVEPDERSARLLGLGTALGGSIYAFRRGGRMSDGEAEASTTMSNLAALTGLGVLGGFANLDSVSGKAVVGALLGGSIPGYALGPRYARQAGFGVTAGDVRLLTLGATLGAMTALVPVLDSNTHSPTAFAAMTAGLVGGALAMHLTWIRSFDHTPGDATLTSLGALAGGLAGSAVTVLTDPGDKGAMALMTAGAIVGSVLGHRVANPPRAVGARAPAGDDGGIDLRLSNLALAAAGVPGRHGVISIRF